MHELSVAQNLVELACEHAAAQGARRVVRIQVRLGVLCGLLRPLYFCFGAASRGTLCDGAVLEIEEVPLTVFCAACDAVKPPRSLHSFRCPTCGVPTPKVVTGREMQLVALELGTDEPARSGAEREPALETMAVGE